MANIPGQPDPARHLAQLLVAPPDEQACAQCLDALEAYIEAQLAGEDTVQRMPTVAAHLDGCVACAEAYALIYETRLMGDRLPEPAHVPAPDLSFLAPDFPGRLRAMIEQAVERTGAMLRLSLSQALLDLLPPPAPALALRGAPGAALHELEVGEPGAIVEHLHLTTYSVATTPDRCDLRIQIAIQGREWPDLADVPVMLAIGGQQHRLLTDAWGEVVFTDLPVAALPTLRLEVDGGAAARP